MSHGVPHPWCGAKGCEWPPTSLRGGTLLRWHTTPKSCRQRRIYHTNNTEWSYLQWNILPDRYPAWIWAWISPACHLEKENSSIIGKLFLYLRSHLLHCPSVLLIISYTFFMKSNSRLHYCSKLWHSHRKWKVAITFPPAHKDLEVDPTRGSPTWRFIFLILFRKSPRQK